MTRWLDLGFGERILPFDSTAARAYAEIAADRRHAGRPIGEADCQIAAITRSRGAALVVTRNVKDFEGSGVQIYQSLRLIRALGPSEAGAPQSSRPPLGKVPFFPNLQRKKMAIGFR